MAEQSMRPTERVSFVNLDTLEERTVQFNPTELSHGISAEYTRFQVVGLAHQPHQYNSTSNREFSISVPFRVDSRSEQADAYNTLDFLRSLLYPEEPGGSPPDVLFLWPNTTYVPVKVLSVQEKHTQFNAALQPTRFDLEITMMRVRVEPLLQAEVRERGIRE